MATNKPMRVWLRAAIVAEQNALARAAGTSRKYLYKLASGERTATADLAGRIEAASAELKRVSKGRLPAILRTELCPACSECPYALKCLTGKE